jgi:small subunit ribosomal protein S13
VLDGNKDIRRALMQIKGIGHRVSQSLISSLGFDKKRKLGTLSDKEIEKIEKGIEELHKSLPHWMLNRKKDHTTGEDIHLTGPDLELAHREDINIQKRIKSYRGIRHSLGLPVRGQRTRTSFRKGTTIGVMRKKALQKQQPAKKKERGK